MERPKISARMSTLTLGTGKITRFEDAEKLELHMSPKDYTSLVTQRTHPHDVFSVIQIDRNKKKDAASTGKGTAVVLPKTYITRSGSLFLYSDSKIMKDNQDISQDDNDKTKNLSVQGKAVPKETKSVDSYPAWGRLLSPRPVSTPPSPWGSKGKASRRERISYMKDKGRQNKKLPYSWNYAVTPLKLISLTSNEDLKTVHGLSEAILTYNQGIPTGSDKYANVMHQAWDPGPKTGPGLDSPRGSAKLSSWTRTWLKNENLLPYSASNTADSFGKKGDPDMLALERARTNLTRQSSVFDRAPANTPMSLGQGSTQVREKVRRRVKSSITTTRTYLTQTPKTPASYASFSEDEEKAN